MESKIFRPINFSYTAPEIPAPMVSRPHLVGTILKMFASSTDLICVEGAQGFGKTVLLREFADTVDSVCFGVFIKQASRLSYDPVLARVDFFNQVNWFLHSRELQDRDDPTDGELRTLWIKCAQRLNRSRSRGYIIVDGLHHIPPDDAPIRDAILSLLPFGINPFRFLLSGDIDHITNSLRLSLGAKTFPISTFSSLETDKYLCDLVGDQNLRNKYHAELGGVPSLLASARRQIAATGLKASQGDADFGIDIDSQFEAEWNIGGKISDLAAEALATVLAFGRPVDTPTMARHCSAEGNAIEYELNRLPFVAHFEKPRGWTFVSESYRRHALRKLSGAVTKATEKIVESLLDDPDSDASLKDLPLYLEGLEKTEQLLTWLSEDRLAAILHKTHSAARIEPTLRKIIALCRDSKNDLALTTYAIFRSTIQQVSNTSGIDHEIRARVALGDYEGALAVTFSVPLATQRLRLLAVHAQALSESPGGNPEPLKKQISELVHQVDFSELPKDEAIDISIDLYPVEPKLALSILKEITQGEIEDSSFATAVARISLTAIYSKMFDSPQERGDSKLPESADLLVDKKLRDLLEVSRVVFNARSAEEVLESTSQIEDPGERLFIQRTWLSQHPTRDDAIDVVERAIHDAIAEIEFVPNATFYREISTPLPYCANAEQRQKLVAVLDGQRPIALTKGPSVDFVRLQLQLAHCESLDGDFERAGGRLEDAYLDVVEATSELEIRVTCLAWFAAEIHRFDPSERLSKYSQIKELVDEELEGTFVSILSDCADQFTIVSNALEALALYLPETALSIAGRLNTIDRREEAILHIATAMCSATTVVPNGSFLLELLDYLEQGEGLDVATKEVVERFCRDVKEGTRALETLLDLEIRIDKCSSLDIRVECFGLIAKTIAELEGPSLLQNSIASKLLKDFSHIGSPSNKYRIACKLIASIKPNCPDLAGRIFEYISDPKRGDAVGENVEEGLFFLLDLLTKATYALGRSNLLSDGDVESVCGLIVKARDPLMKVTLFSTLAFFLRQVGKTECFSKVINDHLWPTLSSLSRRDASLVFEAWSNAYPVVWLEDRDRARNAVESFPQRVRNQCVSALCFSILRGQPPGEPFDDFSRNVKLRVGYSEIVNLLHLCDDTDDDSAIFTVFQWLADDITENRLSNRLSGAQKAEISRRMLEIAELKLPVANRIRHPGFQILCKCQALRIFAMPSPTWDSLIKAGGEISNAADRTYVLAHIAAYLPKKFRKQKDRLFESVENEAGQLQATEDQYNLLCMLHTLIANKDRHAASRVLEKAFATVTKFEDRRNTIRENRLVDLAYRLDPELPLKLANIYDDDPARERYRRRAQLRLQSHQLKEEIGDSRRQVNLHSLRDNPHLATATWRALGSLNSGRMISADISRLRDMLTCASNYPLKTSYPMYSWVLSNAMIKYATTEQAAQYIRGMFEGVVRGTKFLFHLTDPGSTLVSYPDWQDSGGDPTHLLVQNGERDKAISHLKNWIEENADEEIIIVDPYFQTTDLELVLLVAETDPELKVRIITGKGGNQHADRDLPGSYRQAWRQLCEHSPPFTEVFIVAFSQTGKAPFHDRWILSKSTGIRLGTSFNSLGERDTEISSLNLNQLTQVKRMLKKYETREIREVEGNQLTYQLFDLSG